MIWPSFAVLAAAVVAALLFRRHVGFVTRAQAHSMWPTLRPGQFLITRSVRHGQPIRHGDIAVVRSPELGRYVVKRVAGLPGDRLVLGRAGLVRNGTQVAEPYVSRAGEARTLTRRNPR